MTCREPSYITLFESGDLKKRINMVYDFLKDCTLCPHECHVDRTSGQKGKCRAGSEPEISSCNAHFGEEPVLVGSGGSGTIFLTHCTLRCVFCQNYPISQQGVGKEYSVSGLARLYLSLQKRGCENVNFVTPTHYIPPILAALHEAIPKGFKLPLVYNTSGYDREEIIRLLDGIFDIYLPDIKYSSDEPAKKYSNAEDYVKHNRAALKEMFRQVGVLETDERGVARRGLIIRHLVLPENLAGTADSLRWIAENLSTDVHVALMSQYFPAYRAAGFPEISRRVTKEEYRPLVKLHKELGLDGWIQKL